jgi:hypothetical protein
LQSIPQIHNHSSFHRYIPQTPYDVRPVTASGVPRGVRGFNPLQNTEVLTKLSRIPSSVENTSITT